MYRILIVEDDETIAWGMAKLMQPWGYEVKLIEDFGHVLDEFVAYQPHLVILDLTLPFYNGFHWCEAIRQVSKVPLIFVSSSSYEMNMVLAMQMGADDFIAKPFDNHVLLAKVQALLRRTYDFNKGSPLLSHRGVVLHTGEACLYIEGKPLSLTKNEYRILLTLFESKGDVVSRERLIEKLWESEAFIDDNTLTVNINRLRKKLAQAGLEDFIKTRVGQGYSLSEH